MPAREFRPEARFSERNNSRWLALGAAVLMLTGIGLTIWTRLPEILLPMTEEAMSALVPEGFDGGEALGLKELQQQVTGHTLTVSGVIENRSIAEIRNVTVVVEALGVSRHPAMPVEALVEPADVPARQRASFAVTAELNEEPLTYKVRFRIANGPYLPHKDERPDAPPTLNP